MKQPKKASDGKDLTRDVLLLWLESCVSAAEDCFGRKLLDDIAYREIRRIIQQGKPRVTRAWVETWNNRLAYPTTSHLGRAYPGTPNIIAMLRDAGVEVEGEK